MESTKSTTPRSLALLETMNFAAQKHRDQRRKDPRKAPYINHPVGVALNLARAGVTDIPTLQAALLHDTVEDTDATFEEITEHFGEEVTNIVREVTDDKSLPKAERKQLQVTNAPKKSWQAKTVKLGDKLDNFRDLEQYPPEGWEPERVEGYFHWASQVIDGLRGTNSTLESHLDEILARHPSTLESEEN